MSKFICALAAVGLLFGGRVFAEACAPSHAKVHWSTSQHIAPKGCLFTIEISAGKEEGNDVATAKLHSKKTGSDRVFNVTRDGTIHWSNNGLIVFDDEIYSNRYQLEVFDPKRMTSDKRLELDTLLRRAVEGKLPANDQVQFYFPRFVSWTDDGFLALVRVQTTKGPQGSLYSYCFGFRLRARPEQSASSLSPDEMVKSESSHACQG